MVVTALLGVVNAGLTALTRPRLRALREERTCELRAAQLLHSQTTLIIGTLDMALKSSNAKWLPSLSDSRALTTTWQKHWEALQIGLEHWQVIQDAVDGVSPSHRVSGSFLDPGLRRILTQRRERLIDATQILQVIIDDPWAWRGLELKRIAGQRERKWTGRWDLSDHDPVVGPSADAAATQPLRPCPPTGS